MIVRSPPPPPLHPPIPLLSHTLIYLDWDGDSIVLTDNLGQSGVLTCSSSVRLVWRVGVVGQRGVSVRSGDSSSITPSCLSLPSSPPLLSAALLFSALLRPDVALGLSFSSSSCTSAPTRGSLCAVDRGVSNGKNTSTRPVWPKADRRRRGRAKHPP